MSEAPTYEARPRMAGESARDYLILTKRWSLVETRTHVISIQDAFREYWLTNPTEDDFAETMGDVILSARMLYLLATHKRPACEGGLTLG